MEQLAGHQDDLSGQLSRRPRGRRRYTRAGCKVAFLSPWLAVPVLLVCFLFSVAVITGCGEEQNGEPGEAGTVEPGTVESETTESVADRGEPAGAEGRWEEFVTLPLANETCLECHDLAEISTGEHPDEFSHSLHLRRLVDCVVCHGSVGHEGKPAPPRKVCRECHGIPMPHAPNYETTHGEGVREGGDAVCGRCHNVYLHCKECHGLQMPHPTNWAEKHGELTYSLMEVCSRCHSDEYCLRCHPVKMPHPLEWIRTHGMDVAEQSSAACRTCHEPQLCTVCHGMPMPHPGNWSTEHSAMAMQKRGECMLCHAREDCAECHEIHRTHGGGGLE